MKKIFVLLAFLITTVNAQGIIGSPEVSVNSQGNFLITIQIKDTPSLTEADIQLMDFKSTDSLPEKTLQYFLFEDLESFKRLTLALPVTFQETFFSFRLKAGLQLSKDIFIFLPRNTIRESSTQALSFKLPAKKISGQPRRYDIQAALSETSESKSVEIVANKQRFSLAPSDPNPDEIATNEQRFLLESSAGRVSSPEIKLQLTPQVINSDQIETIWSAAKSVELDFNASIYQVMWAFYLENPNAFIDENINLVRSDLDLVIPSAALVQSTSNFDAKSAFDFMSSRFKDRSMISGGQLTLTAPKNIQIESRNEPINSIINPNSELSSPAVRQDNINSSGDEIIDKNTSIISLNLEGTELPESLPSESNAAQAFQLKDLFWVGFLSLILGFFIAFILIRFNRHSSFTKTAVEEDLSEKNATTFQANLSISNDIETQELDLVRTYVDMGDWENAEKILQKLILHSSNLEIVAEAKEILEKQT